MVGLNCHRGPDTMLPLLQEIRKAVKCHVAALPVPYRTTSAATVIHVADRPVLRQCARISRLGSIRSCVRVRKCSTLAARPTRWASTILASAAGQARTIFAHSPKASDAIRRRADTRPTCRVTPFSARTKRSGKCRPSIVRGFDDDGPIGTFFRYICDNGIYIARYDDLINARDERIDLSAVDVSMNGIELQDREFVAAIRERREPDASVQQVLPCYRVLNELDRALSQAQR